MRNSTKLLGAVAVAGVVAATGSAFTGGGLTSSAPQSQFVGGTVGQTVSGAILESTAYTVVDNVVTNIHLTFDTAADGKALTVTFGGASYSCDTVVSTGTDCTGSAANNAGDLSVTVL
jgi:hypothetical protein